MNATPETRYTKTADGVHIAYQLFGEGPLNAVFVPWWWNNVEAAWEEPGVAQFYDRLGSFCRVLVFDQRGTGLSDPVTLNALPSLEEWMDDLRAVLDAAGWNDVAADRSRRRRPDEPVVRGELSGADPSIGAHRRVRSTSPVG
jgi:hypothetical protein